MKGLIYKDNVAIVTGYWKNALLVLAIYGGMAFGMDTPFMLYAMVFLTGMYTLSTLSFDEASHWDAYVRTLPVSARQVVGAKYLLSLLWMGGGVVLALVLLTLISLVRQGSLNDLGSSLGGCLASLGVVLVYYALSYPLSYKVGANKARTAVMLAMSVLFLLIVLFARFAMERNLPRPAMLDQLGNMNDAQGLGLILLVTGGALVLYGISWVISIAIYRRKEY